MEYKQLYNVDDDVLITLYPSVLRLEVKGDFVQNYQLDAVSFTIIFLLCASRPDLVSYRELIEILQSVGIPLDNAKELDSFIQILQKKLSSYRVKHFIVHVKKRGYGISKNWVDPIEAKKKTRRLMHYVKKIYSLVNTSTNNS